MPVGHESMIPELIESGPHLVAMFEGSGMKLLYTFFFLFHFLVGKGGGGGEHDTPGDNEHGILL